MSIDPLFYMRTAEAEPAIPELTVVALRAELRLADEGVLPAAAEGTVVGLWGTARDVLSNLTSRSALSHRSRSTSFVK